MTVSSLFDSLPDMNRRKFMGSLAILAAFSGNSCTGLLKPSDSRRRAEYQRAEQALASQSGRLERAGFLLVASDHDAPPRFSADRLSFHLNIDGGATSGLATPFTSEGYLLTAAHTVKRFNWVIGWANHLLGMFPARPVQVERFRGRGREFAVLHIAATPDSPLEWASLPSNGTAVFALTWNRQAGMRPAPVAGRVLAQERTDGDPFAVVKTSLPLWKGDSGAGVINESGHLIGVAVSATMNAWSLKKAGLVCAPDRPLIDASLARDRAATVGTQAPQRIR